MEAVVSEDSSAGKARGGKGDEMENIQHSATVATRYATGRRCGAAEWPRKTAGVGEAGGERETARERA